jgi:DNA-binding response OmpR family regulator
MISRPVILLIENDEGDVFLFRRALGKQDFRGTVRVISSIPEAQRYLTHCGEFTDKEYYPCPDLIVADMNLRGRLGTELLAWVREQADLAKIPFVFLSGSFLPPDRVKAVELGADGFFVKTVNMEQTAQNVSTILRKLDKD